MRRLRRRPLPRPARNRKPTFTCKNVAKTRLRSTGLCQQAARCAQYSAPTTQCRERKWSFAPDGKCSRRKPDKEAWRNGGDPSIELPHPALPAPAQKASSPSVARTCVRSRDHGRTIARARVCTRGRTKRRPHLRLHPLLHLRPHLHPYPCCSHGRTCACACARTKRRPHPHLYPRRGHGRKKGPHCPPHRRTHLRKIATGREVKFNFSRIWPLLANNPRS